MGVKFAIERFQHAHGKRLIVVVCAKLSLPISDSRTLSGEDRGNDIATKPRQPLILTRVKLNAARNISGRRRVVSGQSDEGNSSTDPGFSDCAEIPAKSKNLVD